MRRSTAAAVGLLLAALLVTACDTPDDAPGDRGTADRDRDRDRDRDTNGAGGEEIFLTFAGDIHFEAHLGRLLRRPREGLGPISHTLSAADITMVNLESSITTRGTPDPKQLEDTDDRYWFRTRSAALDLLDRAGVDVVGLANNHAADYGAVGFADTLRAVTESPVPVVGVGKDREAAFTPHQVTVRGTDVAVFAADASAREGTSSRWAAGRTTPGIASARDTRTGALLDAVRRAADRDELVVVYVHWGTEYDPCPNAGQRTLARDLADAGADVVVGSHPHVLQGAGWLGDTYVAYGLGNFVWYHNSQAETGALRLRVADGRVIADTWLPARIREDGLPRRVVGDAAADARQQWGTLRACTGLSARPAESAGVDAPSGSASSYAFSVRRIGPVLRAEMASSHGPGCPVPWRDLRRVRLTYVGFDGRDHRGAVVVHERYVTDVATVFRRLYDARWPIRQMRPVSDFGGDDDRSMAADNTSAFNCRTVAGQEHWSAHAYGAAVDINPVENPYVVEGSVQPPSGRRFAALDRSPGSPALPGVIVADDVVVEAFREIGWEWGGRWAAPDYQHFYAP
ncbi:CapA family protein [Nocardioides sp. HM23]|uniref:CapA family protein n=1 Tax=Nocardioides bizhenqiangii TaxID=3095076 RepID=UPI002ACA4D6A|nr:CapA family protein [Nocardioides sp. HM23]MDZ5621288.1 CapA family protein [Nocardioides sp. HM23]